MVAVEDGADSLVSYALLDEISRRLREVDDWLIGSALCRFNLVNHNQHGVDTAKYGQKESSSS